MRQEDPASKAVVFSAWTNVLKLVADAFGDNNVTFASLSAYHAANRARALQSACAWNARRAVSRPVVVAWSAATLPLLPAEAHGRVPVLCRVAPSRPASGPVSPINSSFLRSFRRRLQGS